VCRERQFKLPVAEAAKAVYGFDASHCYETTIKGTPPPTSVKSVPINK